MQAAVAASPFIRLTLKFVGCHHCTQKDASRTIIMYYLKIFFSIMKICVVGNRREFPCPICRTRTAVPERGMEALPDNRYLQELIENQAREQWKTCRKHNTALSLYCNDCEKCICASCGLVTHRTHDIIELDDKAQAAKKEMQDGVTKATKHIEGWQDLVGKIDEGKEKVSVMTDAALKKIEDSRSEFRNMIKRLSNSYEEASKIKINEIRAMKTKSIKGLNKSKQNIQNKKNGIERQIEEMARQLKMDQPSEVIELSKETLIGLEKILKDSTNINTDMITAKVPGFNKPNLHNQLRLQNAGATTEEALDIGRPIKAWKPRKWASLELQFWESSMIAVGQDGSTVVVGKKHSDEIVLKCFNKDGHEMWEQCISDDDKEPDIRGIAIVRSFGIPYVMTTDCEKQTITLRKLSDGLIVNRQQVSFPSDRITCYSPWEGFMLNWSSKIIYNFKLKWDATVQVMNWMGIKYDFPSLYGFCATRNHTGQMMCILGSWEHNKIRAINAANGKIIWEIVGQYERVEINPHGMCADDSGHIYVADGENCRVLQVSCTGEIERCLLHTEGIASDVKWLEMNKKLLVFHEDDECDSEAITVYEM